MFAPWKKSNDKPRQHIQKQRHYFSYKGPCTQSYDFSNSHVQMWDVDNKKAELMPSSCIAGEVSWESLGKQGDQISQSLRKSTLNIHQKGWCWSWNPNTLAIHAKNQAIGKDSDAGKDWRQEKGTIEDEMVGWHHWLNPHEPEQTPGDKEGQGSLSCCSPWGCKELDMIQWLNNNNTKWNMLVCAF